jgi:hypothetical protein
MNRMRELMEKGRETRLADEEKQELQKHFVVLAAHESAVCRTTELFAAMGRFKRHPRSRARARHTAARSGRIAVPQLITERIKKLRREIAELSEKNRKYSLDPKYGSAVADNARRFQRLMEIVEELKSLTDWKKP